MLQTLDAIVGIVVIFLLFSLVVSSAHELVAAFLRSRNRTLKKGLDQILRNLGDQKLADDFWSHAFITSLQTTKIIPSYIPSENIASALLHITTGNKAGEAVELTRLKAKLIELAQDSSVKNKNLATVLATLIERAGVNANLASIQTQVEKWVDNVMERISSMYQRRTRNALFVIAFVLSILMNIDSVAIWQRIQSDKNLRDSLIVQAQAVKQASLSMAERKPSEEQSDKESVQPPLVEYRNNLDRMTNSGLPIGWTPEAKQQLFKSFWSFSLHACGLLISAVAASLGAPFWFDLLKNIMNIRAAVKPILPSSKTNRIQS